MGNIKQVQVKSYDYYVKEKVLKYMKQKLAQIIFTCWYGWANQMRIEEYIHKQLQEDVIADQISLFEEYDSFTGENNKIEKYKSKWSA